MGCWSETCAISNLPIEAGDACYLILLNESPYKDGRGVYSTSFFNPWSLPILGKYDDYGGIEEWDEVSAAQTISLLKKCVIEKEQGENPYHEQAVSKDTLDMKYLQELLHDSRIEIENCGGFGKQALPIHKILIRKDVWDALLKTEQEHWYSDKTTQFQDLVASIDTLIEHVKTTQQVFDDKVAILFEWFLDSGPSKGQFASFLNDFYFMNHEYSGKRVVKRVIYDFLTSKVTEEEVRVTCRNIAELFWIHSVLQSVRKNWAPTTGSGSQSTNWKGSVQFYKAMLDVAIDQELERLADSYFWALEDDEDDELKATLQKLNSRLYQLSMMVPLLQLRRRVAELCVNSEYNEIAQFNVENFINHGFTDEPRRLST